MNDTTKAVVCYCGAEIKPHGEGWLHLSNNSQWCYESEADLDPESRCDAQPDPDANHLD